MKRIVLTTFLALSLVSGLTSPSNAVQKSSGSTCSKNGAVKVLNSVKLVCKKVGKSLIWTQTGANKEERPAVVDKEIPKQNPVNRLTLKSSIEAESKLRLELVEDVYLGHCASFLVYSWGIADSYEGVFYRQKKEYLIPVDLSSKGNLPLSFTFGCSGYPIQSYAIEWALKENVYTPTVKALQAPINKLNIQNSLPEKFDLTTPGEIRVGFPRIENVENSMIFQDDGYFASETAISFGVNKRLDSCVAKILNSQGIDVKNKAYGPGVSTSYNVAGLLPSGFDRINGYGYVSYKGSKNEELTLEISCLGSGNYTSAFFHPAPKVLLNVTEEAKCPASYKDQTLPSLKPANLELTCKEEPIGNFTWTSVPKGQATPTNRPAPTVTLSPEEQKKLKVMIRTAQSLGLKAQKIQQNLQNSLKGSASNKFSSEKISRMNALITQAGEIHLRSIRLNTASSFSQTATEIAQLAQRFEVLESSYGDLLESS
ncbi:MAG: hypothetical protein F2851_05995 [Actinobacteria bacterium]|uniref:Unannotated protein n=1 Tax=freshwater metagenome TaxID=449393 RepID=A0A6J5ZLC6_9ZZZZ|nr:hypothetical protein [Actinomycetota bacterium]